MRDMRPWGTLTFGKSLAHEESKHKLLLVKNFKAVLFSWDTIMTFDDTLYTLLPETYPEGSYSSCGS